MASVTGVIDNIFVKAHLSFIPSIIRYVIVLMLCLSPMLAICYMMFADDDEEEFIPPPQIKKVDSAKPEKTKREKIE